MDPQSWAALAAVATAFWWLVQTVMKENAKRENGYQRTIHDQQVFMQGLLQKFDKLEDSIDALAEVSRGG